MPPVDSLATAIGQRESSGNYNAIGKPNSKGQKAYGKYQVMDFNVPSWTKEATGTSMNPQQFLSDTKAQDTVAKHKLGSYLKQYGNPQDAASVWFSGRPVAKAGNAADVLGTTVPQYVSDVTKLLKATPQNLAVSGGGDVQMNSPKQPSREQIVQNVNAMEQQGAKPQEVQEYLNSLSGGQQRGSAPPPAPATTSHAQQQAPTAEPAKSNEQQNQEKLNQLSGIVSSVFPGKQVGESIGTLGGLLYEKAKGLFGGQDNSKYYDTSAPTPLQTAADVAQGAMFVAPGMGMPLGMAGKGALPVASRIGANAALGAGFGATGALKEGETSGKELGKQALIGGAIGGALGGAGEIVSKAAEFLPKRFASGFLKTSPDVVEHAVKRGLGSPKTMLAASDTALNDVGAELNASLRNPSNSYVQPNGEELLSKVSGAFPESGLMPADIAEELKGLVPLKRRLVDKMVSGNITLEQLHELNSAVGKATYKTVFDNPTVKAGKQVGNTFYHMISDFLKHAAPDSAPLFDEFTKEIQLNAALTKLASRSSKLTTITLRDLVAFTSLMGATGGNFLAGVGGVAAEKLLTSPGINLGAMGYLSKLASPTAQTLGQGLKTPLMSTLINKAVTR